MSLDEGERIARETSNILDQEEKKTVNAVNRILEESYNQLEKKFTKEYDKAQKAGGSLFKQEQAAFALDQIGEAANLLPGKRAERVRKEYRKLLKTAQEKGIESGERLAQTVSPDGVDDFAKIDVNIEAVKAQARDGVKRLKNHTEKFRNRLNTLVGANLAMGSSPRKAAQQLRKEFAVTKDRADSIARTESMSALNDATNAFYEENEINYVLRIETEDQRTCPFCQARAGKIYKVSEKPGLAHPRCRVFYMPTSPRWQNQKDMEWASKHRREVQELNPSEAPNYNPTPFERASGTQLNPISLEDFLADTGDAPASTNEEAPEPEPEPTPSQPVKLPDSVEDLEVVKELGGSTGAQLVKDSQGNEFVLKRGNSRKHIEEEITANKMYEAAGVNVPRVKRLEDENNVYQLSEKIEGQNLQTYFDNAPTADTEAVKQRIQQDFAVDAALGNWDVVGLEKDNILVTPDGTPYRVDNGGALRYRAGGESKNDAWNGYPTEIWSLRNPDVNEQTADVYSGMSIKDISDQMKNVRDKKQSILNQVEDSDLRNTMDKRFKEMDDSIDLIDDFTSNSWKETYTSRVAKHSMGLRKKGTVDKMSERMNLSTEDKPYVLVDENQQFFDNIRGHNSVTTDVIDYVNNVGDYEVVRKWLYDQATDSWSKHSQSLRYLVSESRAKPEKGHYWKYPYKRAKNNYKENINQHGKETYEESMAAYQAATYQTIKSIDLPNKDPDKKTLKVSRTENPEVIQDKKGFEVGDKNIKMQRGNVESGSLVAPVSVYGTEVTIQEVPYSKVMTTYMLGGEERVGKKYTNLANDEENEVVFVPDDLPFDYTASVEENGDPATNLTLQTEEPEFSGAPKQPSEASEKAESSKQVGEEQILAEQKKALKKDKAKKLKEQLKKHEAGKISYDEFSAKYNEISKEYDQAIAELEQ